MKSTRKTFSSEFKAKVAIEAIKEIKTISELSHEFGVHPSQITMWKKAFLSNAGKVFEKSTKEGEQIKKLEQEKQELTHQIGEISVENNWLKKKLL